MTEDSDYSPFRRDRETSREIRRLLSADYRIKRDRRIVRAVETEGINFVNIMQGLDAKRRIIRDECGYEGLWVARDLPAFPLSECSPHRINTALRREYMAAKRRQEKGDGK